jgi:integrase
LIGDFPQTVRRVGLEKALTGWRTPSEILTLEWRQVDLKVGEVRRLDPGTTKNDDGRVFPFTSALRRVLEDQQKVADTLKRERGLIARHVFCYTTAKKVGQRVTESGFNKAWRKARVAAGCPGRIPHDFRRTAVRNLVRAAVPERAAMQLTGHKTRAVFERYDIVRRGDLRDAAARHVRVCCRGWVLNAPSGVITNAAW